MKLAAIQHHKVVCLSRWMQPRIGTCLIDPLTVAVGTLERLWILTAKETPLGSIGQFNNEQIATSVGWMGDADAFINQLVQLRLLDTHPEHRLVIHDWQDHAPPFVQANAKRWKWWDSKPKKEES